MNVNDFNDWLVSLGVPKEEITNHRLANGKWKSVAEGEEVFGALLPTGVERKLTGNVRVTWRANDGSEYRTWESWRNPTP